MCATAPYFLNNVKQFSYFNPKSALHLGRCSCAKMQSPPIEPNSNHRVAALGHASLFRLRQRSAEAGND